MGFFGIGWLETGIHASSVHWNSYGNIIQYESVLLRAQTATPITDTSTVRASRICIYKIFRVPYVSELDLKAIFNRSTINIEHPNPRTLLGGTDWVANATQYDCC